ncbi:hypothetical protein [Rhodospirillum rubrum]|uniref:Transmembrane protein n=1 Tax=Rhodospirillum rubrum (strain ATCC 11170 / ATH 1.1.1 / DSM 467 / LMG 4362 / NCIMB 8255 / S1) TaxID=269796 RepID=Q2RRY2_RHORT|nr:hypothetical protein [Rhodospirillum rubrum]ABC23113.1 hypothetical protein Rru_A2313 [Rhodospirillum rubrum ATCC 11170]AEO48843.1 hypothetical protein F11_11895 [Rhodospirillum rubrum F11]MBK1665430.1 hypothetical protein [Rhodospirillum rubrum]MBK1677366.1 hypothetical protein [Rhodospirillum rubrum]MBK5954727.1 hypothetical protein [Rhodospirillum rubrum]
MAVTMALGLTLALAGCLSLYLTSPHQRLTARPCPARPLRAAGGLLLGLGLIVLGQTMQMVAAVFTLGSWIMLCFVALPYLGLLVASSPRPAADRSPGEGDKADTELRHDIA